jgi:GT2 family glycosyltransferase
LNQPKIQVTASIVLYKNDPLVIRKAIDSFLKITLRKKLFLIDNSPSDELRILGMNNTEVEYIKNQKNIGFGKAHNIGFALSQRIESKYHIVLNPDVYFNTGTIEDIFKYAEQNQDVGLISPKILYPDGSLQTLCKLLPTPSDLFIRRFLGFTKYAKNHSAKYELHGSGYDKVMNVPYLSGCFMFLRNSVLQQVGGFEEKIFMYIEDADLTRRIFKTQKTIYYPKVYIYHGYQKGSYKSIKLMLYNIHGAVIYFNKWGWFWDRERTEINKEVIATYLCNS